MAAARHRDELPLRRPQVVAAYHPPIEVADSLHRRDKVVAFLPRRVAAATEAVARTRAAAWGADRPQSLTNLSS